MNILTVALRTLAHDWRSELTLVAGTAVAALVLAGALGVGDTARLALRARTEARVGQITQTLVPPDRLFRAALADELQARIGGTAAPVLLRSGTATRPDTTARAPRVRMIGVDRRFWTLCPAGQPPPDADRGLLVNSALADRLHLAVNEEIVLTAEPVGAMPPEMGLAFAAVAPPSLRLTVAGIVDNRHFGAFNLQSAPDEPLLAFLPLSVLQEELGRPGFANAILFGPGDIATPAHDPERLDQALRQCWTLADIGLECYQPPESAAIELRSPRLFLDPAMARVALALDSNATAILTYFVHTIRAGTHAIPFSMVSALSGPPLAAPLAADDILLSQWAAEDLQVTRGQAVTLEYWVLDRHRQLVDRRSVFRLADVVGMDDPVLDRSLVPAFPGLASASRCRDWNPALPLDLNRIRPQDEEYWNRYRETPKAVISLAAGRAAWSNDFGWLTSVRFPQARWTPESLARVLLTRLDPADCGFQFQPVRDPARSANSPAMDFGQLFLGLSFFLLLAAVILTALCWSLHLSRRMNEIGLLHALGFRPGQIHRLYLAEGMVLALLGAAAGTVVSTGYSRLLFHGLWSIWYPDRAMAALDWPSVLPLPTALSAIGIILGVMLVTLALTLRALGGGSIRALLAGEFARQAEPLHHAPDTLVRRTAAVALLAALVLRILGARQVQSAVWSLAAGGLALLGGIAVCHILFQRWSRPDPPGAFTLAALGRRNAARRRSRSLSVIGIMACGTFLLVAVNASRTDPTAHAERRSSGTGGFRWIGETSLPLREDLNAPVDRQKLGLNDPLLAPVRFVACRVRDGDDASCRNPDRAQNPSVLGLPTKELADRDAFRFGASVAGLDRRQGWRLLDTALPAGVIPVAVDEITLQWGLGKRIGDELTLRDDSGRPRRLRVVAVTQPSILQGRLLMSSASFLALFPSSRGHQLFLIDAPSQGLAAIEAILTRQLEDHGLALTPAADRLKSFLAGESMYLDLFQVLGGLGLLLGGLGFGILVWRNIVERRAELGLLQALGYPKRSVRTLLFREHALQLGLGLAIGTLAGLLTVQPLWLRRQGWAALGMTLAMLGIILIGGLAAIVAGIAIGTRVQPLPALREE